MLKLKNLLAFLMIFNVLGFQGMAVASSETAENLPVISSEDLVSTGTTDDSDALVIDKTALYYVMAFVIPGLSAATMLCVFASRRTESFPYSEP